ADHTLVLLVDVRQQAARVVAQRLEVVQLTDVAVQRLCDLGDLSRQRVEDAAQLRRAQADLARLLDRRHARALHVGALEDPRNALGQPSYLAQRARWRLRRMVIADGVDRL